MVKSFHNFPRNGWTLRRKKARAARIDKFRQFAPVLLKAGALIFELPQVFEVMLFRREFGHGLRPEQGLTLSAARRLRYTLARRQDC